MYLVHLCDTKKNADMQQDARFSPGTLLNLVVVEPRQGSTRTVFTFATLTCYLADIVTHDTPDMDSRPA